MGFIAQRQMQAKDVVLSVPEDMAVTSIDAVKQDTVGELASECGELVALTLWLLAERAKGAASQHVSLLATLPDRTTTPILWSDAELDNLLTGSPVLEESRSRARDLKRQWQELHDEHFSKDVQKYSPEIYGYQQFVAAFSVILAHTVYLPSVQLFALLPLVSVIGRTGNGNGCDVDYDEASHKVVVTTGRSYREGQEILLNDERPNGELLMATGSITDSNLSDFVEFPAQLIEADRYFVMKSQILESMGFKPKERFPVFVDRMPNQLLAYIRLVRIQDPALFAKISFQEDVVLSQMNEYEVLQLLMGDCRERLALYSKSLEEDIKINQDTNLSAQERLAVKLRLSEKRIISSTMDAVRTRLAPIRGIPVKGGSMQDINSDIKEIFDVIESIPKVPKSIIDGFLGWASGRDDPEWGKAPPKKKLPPKPW